MVFEQRIEKENIYKIDTKSKYLHFFNKFVNKFEFRVIIFPFFLFRNTHMNKRFESMLAIILKKSNLLMLN